MAIAQSSPAHRRLQVRHGHRLVKRFDVALSHMRAGETLHYCDGHPIWSLSSGSSVTADAASLLINCANVVPTGNSLFPDLLLGQSWESEI